MSVKIGVYELRRRFERMCGVWSVMMDGLVIFSSWITFSLVIISFFKESIFLGITGKWRWTCLLALILVIYPCVQLGLSYRHIQVWATRYFNYHTFFFGDDGRFLRPVDGFHRPKINKKLGKTVISFRLPIGIRRTRVILIHPSQAIYIYEWADKHHLQIIETASIPLTDLTEDKTTWAQLDPFWADIEAHSTSEKTDTSKSYTEGALQ